MWRRAEMLGNHGIKVYMVKMKLHGIFWYHTVARPVENKYVHVGGNIIHNYPLFLSLLGKTVETTYVSVSDLITQRISHEEIWRKHSFYVYPARAIASYGKLTTFTMGGTGYVEMKPKTRAPVPDITSHYVYVPGTVYETYILTRRDDLKIPEYIRIGAKRYGVFRLSLKRADKIYVQGADEVTHPYNVSDCDSIDYSLGLIHYAGGIAVLGKAKKTLKAVFKDEKKATVLAVPRFIGV